MDITLSTGTPTADQTGLTAGAAYSVFHRGGITLSLVIGGTWTQVYDSGLTGPGVFVPALPGTAMRFGLSAGSTAAGITITAKS